MTINELVPAPLSRNDSCPCGSGRRFKHCHGSIDSVDHGDPQASSQVGRAGADGASEPYPERPGDPEALFHLGNSARQRGALDAAIVFYEQALAGAPANVGLLGNLGLALQDAGSLMVAERHFRAAYALAPGAFAPLANLAQNLFKQQLWLEAATLFDELVARFEVRHASLWANRGVCHANIGNVDAAKESFTQALIRDGSSAATFQDLGFLELAQKRYHDALTAFEKSLAIEPAKALAQSGRLICRQYLIDWRDFDRLRAELIATAARLDDDSTESLAPFGFMTICDDPALQQKVARAWVRNKPFAKSAPRPASSTHRPLRLGFVGSGLEENHPVARLLVELLEQLDRQTFHVTLYAIRTTDRTAFSQRVKAAADQFVEMPISDVESLYRHIREQSIDVLFDIDGYTGLSNRDLFLRRAAFLQVNFLGYTGTMGSDAYDYIIVDRQCCSENDATFFSEKLLFVEPCYISCDSRRVVAADTPSRSQYGLREGSVVLCAFAGIYKILPECFAAWLDLLRKHPKAVLWLRDEGDIVSNRLRAEAAKRDVDVARLVFAPPDPIPRYLARFRLADLFLDAVPFGSHTTVNDALFAGLPAIAVHGASFAGRASASQIRTAGMPDLIARDLEHYFAIADGLLRAPSRLAEVQARAARCASSPLFDTARYARSFESAVISAWEAMRDCELNASDASSSVQPE